MMPDALRIEHLSKTFAGQIALDDVSIDVAAGEVHALVGQNGSGKSTLIKILAGYHQPDPGDGEAWVNGLPLALGNGSAASDAGIRFVHQDLGLVGMLNAIDNLAITAGYQTGRGGRIHWRQEASRTREALATLGLADLDIKAQVHTLHPSQRTAIAIARALVGWEDGASLLILDEPTATLPGADVRRLFDVIHRLRERGVSILYVSHHLDEVFELADRVSVLRDGVRKATVSVSELDHGGLVELMVGRRIDTALSTDSTVGTTPALTVRGLRGRTVNGLDIDVMPGEIVGLAGITGSGREHVLGLIAGQTPREDGDIMLEGKPIANYRPRKAMATGVAFVPAERALRGTIGPMNVRENLTITDVGRFVKAMRLSRSSELAETKVWVDRLSVKTASTESPIGSLSGGNQQKVMFGKALRLSPRMLLLDEPTQGVDIGAKDQIHSLVESAAAEGVATLVASTDTDELVRLCDRVIVLVDGRAVATLRGAEITPDMIEHTQLQTSGRIG
jgi:ribose transport system ATP-binding protein